MRDREELAAQIAANGHFARWWQDIVARYTAAVGAETAEEKALRLWGAGLLRPPRKARKITCSAMAATGRRCQAMAMGNGRCRYHGGC